MSEIQVNGATLHYEEHGHGNETIVFAHGLLWSGEMFAAQVSALKDRYRCVTFDFRGQGQSEVTAEGYDMDTLAQDAAALIEALDVVPCHFLGLSMGGFVGLRLAIRRPELLRSLILLESSADPEAEENMTRYRLLGRVGRWLGLRLVAGQVMAVMFGEKFLQDPARAEEREAWRQRFLRNSRVGLYRALQGVVNRKGVYGQLDQIALPTLIIVGDHDVALVPARSKRMHAAIRDSKLVVISDAGHTSTVEEPGAVNAALEAFLEAVG